MFKNNIALLSLFTVCCSYAVHKGSIEDLQTVQRLRRHKIRLQESHKKYNQLADKALERQQKEEIKEILNCCACLFMCGIGAGSVWLYLKKQQ